MPQFSSVRSHPLALSPRITPSNTIFMLMTPKCTHPTQLLPWAQFLYPAAHLTLTGCLRGILYGQTLRSHLSEPAPCPLPHLSKWFLVLCTARAKNLEVSLTSLCLLHSSSIQQQCLLGLWSKGPPASITSLLPSWSKPPSCLAGGAATHLRSHVPSAILI